MPPERVALVTGAAGGQGRSIVRRLHADGFAVAACDINRAGLDATVADATDDAVIAVPLDVTSQSQWQSAVAATISRLGTLKSLNNYAGVMHRATLSETSSCL